MGLLLAACNTGNNFVAEQPDLMTVSSTPLPDLAPVSSPDLLVPGPSCAQVAECAIGGLQDPTMLATCFTGVAPQTVSTILNLLVCAGTSCLAGAGGLGGLLGGGADAGAGGGIDQTQLLLCLAQSCSTQLSMCGGFGGFGGGQ